MPLASFYILLKYLILRASCRGLGRVRGELGWVATGQVFAFVGSFFSVKLLTNVLGPRGYGELAFGITIAGLIQIFIYSPFGQVVIRFLSICRERAQLPAYFFLARRAHVACASLVTMAILAASATTDRFVGRQWALIVLFGGFYGLGSGINISFSSFQAALRQRNVVALHQGAETWLRPLIALALLFAFRNSGYVALLGFFLAVVLVDVSQWIFAQRNCELRANWNSVPSPGDVARYRRELLAYGSPFLIWAGIGSISMFGDRWTLQYLSGAQELGIYAAMYQIANAPISVMGGIINQFMVPVIFERAGALSSPLQATRSVSLLYKTAVLFLLLMAGAGAVIYLFSEPLARLVTSPLIARSHQLLWIIFCGLVVFQLGQMMVIVGQIYQKTKAYILAYAINAVTTLGCSYFFGKRYGALGIAIALCVSNSMYLSAVLGVNVKIKAGARKAWKSASIVAAEAKARPQQLGGEHALESAH